jgi:thiol-disulfide isomerase/thioredoxin
MKKALVPVLSVLVFALSSAASAQEREVILSREPVQAQGARNCIYKMIERELTANQVVMDKAFAITQIYVSTNMRAGPPLTENSVGESLWIDYRAEGRVKGFEGTAELVGTTSLRNYKSGVTSCYQTGTAGWASFSAYIHQARAEDSTNIFHGRWPEGDDDKESNLPKKPFQHRFPFITEAEYFQKIAANRDSDRTLAVMFTAKWCIYCPGVELKLQEFQAQLGPKLEVVLIDWEQAGEKLAKTQRFIARSLPGVTFFRGGEVFAGINGGDPNLLPLEWLHDQESQQAETPVLNLTPADFREKTRIQDKWVAVVIHNGFHAYHDEQLESLREAQKALKGELVVYQMDAFCDTDDGSFYRKQNLFVPAEKDDSAGAVVALLRNGKVIARLQNQYFKTDALTWIRSQGRD